MTLSVTVDSHQPQGVEMLSNNENNPSPKNEFKFGTLAVHYSQEPEEVTGAVIPPIFLSTTYAQTPYKKHEGYEYSRSGNPTRNALENAIAKLEGGKHGFLFSSGLGAISTFFNMFPRDSEVVVCDDAYGGTVRYLNQVASLTNLRVKMADLSNPEKVTECITNNTKVVWLETPTNPTLKVIDISYVSKMAKKINPSILVVVDNTIMSPYFQRPLELNADAVCHSVTKYINGHSDVVMGAIVTSNEQLAEHLRYYQNAVGSVPSPFDCFLAHRGLKTLHLRMKKCEESALAVSKILEGSPVVKSVNYPGLKSHPGHSIALKQQKGFGGIVSFTLKGNRRHASEFLATLKLFTYGESLGGVESLIEIPALMTHASIPKEQREELGIVDTFIRVSIGIEETEDLVNDINEALTAVQKLGDDVC